MTEKSKATTTESSEATVPPALTREQLRLLLIDFLDRLAASKPPPRTPE
jgi:hypothetical protein